MPSVTITLTDNVTLDSPRSPASKSSESIGRMPRSHNEPLKVE